MDVDVSTQILIARPRDEVFAFASEPDNAPLWYVNIRSVEWQTEPPLAVGSRIAFVAQFLGRRLAYTYEIVELVPPTSLIMRTTDGPFPMETRYLLADAEPRATDMTLRNLGAPTGFSKLFTPFVKRAMRRANRNDLAALKTLMEKDR